MANDPSAGWSESAAEAVKAIRDFGGFISPALKPLIGMVGDHFEFVRAKRLVRLEDRYFQLLEDRGSTITFRRLSPSFSTPLIGQASLEVDDELQDIWAIMLVNAVDASSNVEPRTAFVTMLSELSCFDVQILSMMSQAQYDLPWQHFETAGLPEIVTIRGQAGGNIEPPSEAVEVSLGNLARIGCIVPAGAIGGFVNFGLVQMTKLGMSFIAACTNTRAK